MPNFSPSFTWKIYGQTGPKYAILVKFLKNGGIISQYIWSHTPKQNEVVERKNQYDLKTTLALLGMHI